MKYRQIATRAGLLAVCMGWAWASLGAAAWAQEEPTEEEAAEISAEAETGDEAFLDRWVNGSFRAGFDGRWNSEDSDLNLDQMLRLDVHPTKQEKLRIRGALWMLEDLDGDEALTSGLRDVYDSSSTSVEARLLHLYLEAEDLAGDSILRVGRQRIHEGVAYNRIDGVYWRQQVGPVGYYLFGGLRASIYEDSTDDSAFGGGAALQLASRTRLGVDYFYGRDQRESRDRIYSRPLLRLLGRSYPRLVEQTVENHMVAFSIRQGLGVNWQAYARFTLDDSDADELLLDLIGHIPSINLNLEVMYRGRFDVMGDRVNGVTGYYRILGGYEEYDHLLISLNKPLGEHFALTVESEWHDMDGENELANSDYQRYAAILSAEGLSGYGFSLGVERWNAALGEESWIFFADVTKAWEHFELTLGADYESFEDHVVLYSPYPEAYRLSATLIPGVFLGPARWLYFLGRYEETLDDNVYALFARAKWHIRNNMDLTGRVSYEDGGGPDSPYWTAQLYYEIRF